MRTLRRWPALALIAACSCTSASERPEPIRLRVLSYNIHHGEGTDGHFDLPRLAEVIRSARPDLVALQEVDVGTERSGGVDQARELGRLTGMQACFGEAMPYRGGSYGEAILTRLPTIESWVVPLPASAGYEPRAAIAVRARATPGGPELIFVGTHLDHTQDAANRVAQAGVLIRVFAHEEPGLVLLAGDLNAVPDADPMPALFAEFLDTDGERARPTYPSEAPERRIDYVLARPPGAWRVVSTEVLQAEVASDHRPLLVVLEWVGE